MEKPKHPTLRRVTDLLDERNVDYEVETNMWGWETLYVYDQYREVRAKVQPRYGSVNLSVSQVPVEGAVMAICGPDERLEDGYPILTRHMSFANMSMTLKTDRRDVLMPIEKAELLEKRMDWLLSKVINQRKELKRLHLKCMRQQDEITRMEGNALRMAVLYMGYSEGES